MTNNRKPEPNDMNGNEEYKAAHEGEVQGHFVAMDEVLAELVVYLDVRGFLLVPDPLGYYKGWDIYQRDFILIDGCYVANAKRMTKVGDITDSLKRLVTEWGNFEQGNNRSELWMKKARSVYTSLFESLTQGNVMYSVSQNTNRVDTSILDTQGGTGYGYKVLPVEQFVPTHVRDLDVRELLHVFPDAEATMLMMMLGRGLWGANGQKTLDNKVINHRWRGWCLLHSDAAGMGKSFFKETLESVLVALGYRVAGLTNGCSARFGWQKPATADFTLADDFNADSQRSFVVNESIKIIASNGSLTTEEKGKDMAHVKATSVIIGCTNYNKQAQYIGADEGHISRANVLSVKPEWEIAQTTGEDTIYSQWQVLAVKYETTVEALMMHLLVKSQELFKAYLDANSLEGIYKELRSHYAVKPGLYSLKDMTRATAHIVAFGVAIDNKMTIEEKEVQVRQMLSEYGAQYLLATIAVTASGIPSTSDFYPKGISKSTKKAVGCSMRELRRSVDTEDPQTMFTRVSRLVHTTDGFKYPSAVNAYYNLVNVNEFVDKMHEYMAWSDDAKADTKRTLIESIDILFQ